MKKNLGALLLPGMILVLSTCTGSSDDSTEANFHYTTFIEEHLSCSEMDPQGTCMLIEYIYPQFDNLEAELYDSLEYHMAVFLTDSAGTALTETDFKRSIHEWFSTYDSTRAYFDSYSLPWIVEKHITVQALNSNFLTLEYVDRRFTGGAHGTEFRYYHSFSRVRASRFEVDELVRDGRKDSLMALASRRFRINRQIPAGKRLDEMGFWFPDGNFSLTNNAGLTEKGLLFYYNIYEVAPYSEGPTKILIPYSRLTGILRPEFLPDHLQIKEIPGNTGPTY